MTNWIVFAIIASVGFSAVCLAAKALLKGHGWLQDEIIRWMERDD